MKIEIMIQPPPIFDEVEVSNSNNNDASYAVEVARERFHDMISDGDLPRYFEKQSKVSIVSVNGKSLLPRCFVCGGNEHEHNLLENLQHQFQPE